MRFTRTALIASLAIAAGCDDAPEPAPQAPAEPISAPLAGDLERPEPAAGCRTPVLVERWSYVWEGDLLASAERVDASAQVLDAHRFTWDAADRLARWEGPTPGLARSIERDAAGAIVGWTRTEGDQTLTVSVRRDDDATTLETRGMLYLDFETPPLIDLERLDPDWAQVAPRMDLVIAQLAYMADDDMDALWNVLADSAMTQVERGDGDARVLEIDVDGDGAFDVQERRVAGRIEVDLGIDGVLDQVVEEVNGRATHIERDRNGQVTGIQRIEATADHHFTDTIDLNDTIVARTSLFFDANGQRLIKYEDDDADGRPNWRKRYINDPVTGLRRFDERDSGANGRINERVDYERDAAGRVLVTTAVHPEDGDCGRAW